MQSSRKHNMFSYSYIAALAVMFAFIIPSTSFASISDEIAAKNVQIQELQKQIDEFQSQIDQNRSKAASLKGEIANLNAKISQIGLEIKSLAVSIDQTSLQIQDTQSKITDAQDKLSTHKNALGQYIRLSYETEKKTLTEILLDNSTLSEFFNDVNNVHATQDNIRLAIDSIKQLKSDLDQHKDGLEDKQSELQRLKTLQELEKRSLDNGKKQKNTILQQTKGQESKYQELVKKSKLDLQKLQQQIAYLSQNGVTVEDAVKYGQLAAIAAGIRPEYLLAELEQESALGSNVGKCYIVDSTSGATRRITNGQIYPKGIHPTRDLALFIKITAELGRDAFQTPVSCGSAWGGAMGPAQFIPSTWMGYREEVARLTGHSLPDPWNIQDAFVAAATKLSRDGANSKTSAGEIAASKRYYCGSATSRLAACINYANSVQRLATEIKQNL